VVTPKTGSWPVQCSARGCNGTCSEAEAAEQEEYWSSPDDGGNFVPADAGDRWASIADWDDDWTVSEVESPDGWTFFALCNEHWKECTTP
jgi:hypothetical protein